MSAGRGAPAGCPLPARPGAALWGLEVPCSAGELSSWNLFGLWLELGMGLNRLREGVGAQPQAMGTSASPPGLLSSRCPSDVTLVMSRSGCVPSVCAKLL